MKKFLILALILVGVGSQAAAPMTTGDAYKLDRSSKAARDAAMGTVLYNSQQTGIKAQWDYAVQGGASTSDILLLDYNRQPVKLPTNAIVENCTIDVVTAPIDATNSALLSFGASTTSDLKAASNNLTFSKGRKDCTPNGTAANSIKLLSDGYLKMRIASEGVSGGKINVWVEYVLSD